MYKKLINVREEKGISINKMAKLLNMSFNTYYVKESGSELKNISKRNTTKDFTLDEVLKISKILNVKPEDIFL